MVTNLLRELQDHLGGALIDQASSFLGENKSQTASALGGILPTILGSIAKQASDSNGASSIFDFIKNNNMDGSLLNNVGDMMGSPEKSGNVMDMGSGLLKMLLGSNERGSVIDTIAAFSGLRKDSTNSLMSLAGPILMSLIGKQVSNKGLNLAGLASLLMGQKDFIKAAMPAGLAGLVSDLGFDAIGQNEPQVVTAAAKEEKKGMGWLMPLLLAAAVIFGLFYFLRGTGTGIDAIDSAANSIGERAETVANRTKDGVAGAMDATGDALSKSGEAIKSGAGNLADGAKDMANKTGNAIQEGAGDLADGAKDMAGKAGEMAENAMDATTKAARSALNSIKFAAGSAGEKMRDFMSSTGESEAIFNFKGLNFDTGSADLKESSLEEMSQLAAILKAYPSAKVAVMGYTDNTGNATKNQQLSEARANSVKNYLVRQGIDDNRISTKGFGGANPIATNGTAEGRAQNRRIEVKVMR